MGILALAVLLTATVDRAHADMPVEAFDDGPARQQGVEIPRGRTIIWELYGQLGVQEGVVLGDGASRAPLGLKPLVGFRFLELGDTRLMLGLTLAFPFSIEIGYGEDIGQLALAPGITLARRECANWGWFTGIEVPLVITPERIAGAETELLAGLTLRGGAAWYFLAGLGIYGEVDLDIYFGVDAAAVLGMTGGLVLSWEMFRFKPGENVLPGGGS